MESRTSQTKLIKVLLCLLQVSPPASSVLTDPGPLCDGQSATLICNITGGSRLDWDYQAGGMTVEVASINPSLDQLPSPDPVSVLGVEFTVSLLMPTSPHFVSQISFQASTMMNGGVLGCVAVIPMMVDEQVSLNVANLAPLASSVLTDPGPLCDGQSATLTCNITGGSTLTWDYVIGGMTVRVSRPRVGAPPSSDPIPVLGVNFTVSLLMPTSPHFVSEISFQASTMMNGGVLRCLATTPVVTEQVSLSVHNSPGPPGNVRLSNFMNGTSNSDVTIQWTPPSGESVMYTIVITPPPVSGVVMDTSNTEVTITLLYNAPYTTSVSTSTPCPGQPQDISFTLVACEFPVGVSSDVMLSISGPAQTLYPEGSEIMYQCRPGFQPQGTSTAVCGNNGRWTPDPALHNCTIDCNDPVLPSNANGVISEVTSTTENATVNFQCDEGFVPSGPNTTKIQCTSAGQWIPNPATLLCIVNCSDLVLPSNANGSIGEVTSTTEGATVNFQCEEGLFMSSGLSTTRILCTNVNNMGQWMPNPATLLCVMKGHAATVTVPLSTTMCISESASYDCTTSTVIVGVVTFPLGVVCGAVGAVLVVYCALKWRAGRGKLDLNPAGGVYEDVKTGPLYEDVSPATAAAPRVTPGPQLELKENVAYGHVETK